MYNYNLINPINITYRNPKQNPYTNSKEDEGSNGSAQKPVNLDENRGNQRQFPNGNKVQVDYTQNKVNIAQVVEEAQLLQLMPQKRWQMKFIFI